MTTTREALAQAKCLILYAGQHDSAEWQEAALEWLEEHEEVLPPGLPSTLLTHKGRKEVESRMTKDGLSPSQLTPYESPDRGWVYPMMDRRPEIQSFLDWVWSLTRDQE